MKSPSRGSKEIIRIKVLCIDGEKMAVERKRKHQEHRQTIMVQYEGICHLCDGLFADSIDHVVPVALGGSDHPDNLRPAHTACNSRKGARHYPPWAEDNPNMWIPSHLPETVKAQLKKEQASQQCKARASHRRHEAEEQEQRIIQKRALDKAAKIWRIKNLEPEPPLPRFKNYFCVSVVLIQTIMITILINLFVRSGGQEMTEAGSLIGDIIVYIILGIVVGALPALISFQIWQEAGDKIAPHVRHLFLRGQTTAYVDRHKAWLRVLKKAENEQP